MVTSGENWKGEPCEFYMNIKLHEELQNVKKVVNNKDFDYVSLVCGLPGQGKSTLAQSMAKFLDPNFTLDNIAMTADEFIEKTTNLPKHSAVILDESFAGLNSRVATSKEFLKILNHIQLIRQRNLFIFLCLPNFFDLGKPIAIFRSHHLFVVYGSVFGERGEFAAYGRNNKRQLYVKGIKYINYHAHGPNFRGKFYQQKAIDEKEYDKKKYAHLQAENKKLDNVTHTKTTMKLVRTVKNLKNKGLKQYEISEITGLTEKTIKKYLETLDG